MAVEHWGSFGKQALTRTRLAPCLPNQSQPTETGNAIMTICSYIRLVVRADNYLIDDRRICITCLLVQLRQQETWTSGSWAVDGIAISLRLDGSWGQMMHQLGILLQVGSEHDSIVAVWTDGSRIHRIVHLRHWSIGTSSRWLLSYRTSRHPQVALIHLSTGSDGSAIGCFDRMETVRYCLKTTESTICACHLDVWLLPV